MSYSNRKIAKLHCIQNRYYSVSIEKKYMYVANEYIFDNSSCTTDSVVSNDIIIYNITNLYTGCTFQHKNAVINTCPVKKQKESKTYNNSDKT